MNSCVGKSAIDEQGLKLKEFLRGNFSDALETRKLKKQIANQ